LTQRHKEECEDLSREVGVLKGEKEELLT